MSLVLLLPTEMGSTGPNVSLLPWTPSKLWKLRTLSPRKARHTNTVNAMLGCKDPAAVQGPSLDIPQVQCGLGLRAQRGQRLVAPHRRPSECSSCSAVRPSRSSAGGRSLRLRSPFQPGPGGGSTFLAGGQ